MGWIERKTRFNDTRLPNASLRAEDQKRPSSGGSEKYDMIITRTHTHLQQGLCPCETKAPYTFAGAHNDPYSSLASFR